jgi:hypothetical protein
MKPLFSDTYTRIKGKDRKKGGEINQKLILTCEL